MDTETETSSSAGALMVAAGALLADTRNETVEALTLSALQQAQAVIHRAETTVKGSIELTMT